MQRLADLNLPQRIILVVALAGLLGLFAICLVTKGFSGSPVLGRMPRQSGIYGAVVVGSPDRLGPDRLGPTATWFVWLTALVLWTFGSLWLLRSTSATDDRSESAGDVP